MRCVANAVATHKIRATVLAVATDPCSPDTVELLVVSTYFPASPRQRLRCLRLIVLVGVLAIAGITIGRAGRFPLRLLYREAPASGTDANWPLWCASPDEERTRKKNRCR